MVMENLGTVYTLINLGLCLVACVLHSFGFYILWKVKQKNPYLATQRLYLMHLRVGENIYSIFYGLYFVFDQTIDNDALSTAIYIMAGGGAYVWYLLVLIMLTFDRFLTVYYNIHYITVWSVRKTKQVLAVCFFGSLTASIFFVVYLQNLKEAFVFLALYVWIPVDYIFIVVSVSTYIYIYWRVVKQRNKVTMESLNEQNIEISTVSNQDSTSSSNNNSNNNNVKNNNHNQNSRSSNIDNSDNNTANNNNNNITLHQKGVPRKSFLVPILLITTFVIFISLPDTITFVYMVAKVKQPVFLELTFYILYPLGLISDALIYIILSKDVANYCYKLIRCK